MSGPRQFDLQRFVDAQASAIDRVRKELTAGRKRSHWMWFVFPQIAGLGHSAITLDAWKYVVSVQMHFNDMEMKVRNLFFTLLAAAIGLVGVLQGRKIELYYPDAKVSLPLVVMVAVIPISMLFYFMDRHWYHRLLQGAVKQGIEIEDANKDVLPEIQLGSKIREESPVHFSRRVWKFAFFFIRDPRFRRDGRLHSDQKIELVYKSVMWSAFVVAVAYAAINGIQIHNCTLIPFFLGNVCA